MPSHEYRGQSRRRQRRRAGFSQASTRRPVFMYDQHGRQWSAWVSLKSGRTVAQITPNFSAPWIPEQQYLKVNPENASELFINYPAMLRRRRAHLNEYHQTAVNYARDAKLEVPEFGQYPEQITRKVGRPPKAIEPVVAAMQGNKYILGQTDVVDERLTPFLTRTEESDLLDKYDFGEDAQFEPHARAAKPAEPPKNGGLPTNTPASTDAPEQEEDAAEVEGAWAGFESAEEGEDVDALLEDLDDEFDPEAMGGKTVAPQRAQRVAKQAPRRAGASPVRSKGKRPATALEAQKRKQRAGRKTLADGAAPVISDGGV